MLITAIKIFIDSNEGRKWLSELIRPSNVCYKALGMRDILQRGFATMQFRDKLIVTEVCKLIKC